MTRAAAAASRHIVRLTDTQPAAPTTVPAIYALLARDDARNALIVDNIRVAVESGRTPLVLTERRDHLETLRDGLRASTAEVIVLRGGLRAADSGSASGRGALSV